MAKPPNSPPHSDLDGVHQDEADLIDAAIAADQDSSDLERAEKNSKGRPDRSDLPESRDDRS